jgi:hypothetical protein
MRCHCHRMHVNRRFKKVEFIREYDPEFKKALARESGARLRGDRKSRDTAPLSKSQERS